MKDYCNIIDFFADKCNCYTDAVFIRNYDGRQYKYAEFKDLTAKTTHFLSSFDIRYDDKVCILLPNIPDFLTLLLGVLAKGGVAVNLNINFTADEIRDRLIDADVSMVILTPELHAKLKLVLQELSIEKVLLVTQDDDFNGQAYSIGSIGKADYSTELAIPVFDGNKTAFLQYTGGTTGGIKAAMLTHDNILSNIIQIRKHFGDRLVENAEVMPASFPLYHVFALTFNIFTFLNIGATCLMYPVTRDLPQLIKLMKENPVTCFVGVNTLYKLLMQSKQLTRNDLPALKICIGGGEHIQYKTKMDWERLSGVPVYEAYGMTETSAMAIVNPVNEMNDPETIGVPIPDTDVCLLDENDQVITEDDIHGEILLRGPQVISQYWKKQEENNISFKAGWLRTGDIAVWKNGRYLKIVDRKKDMISVSGFKVFPNEVETVIAAFEGIIDCAVVGEYDEQTGERVVLYYMSQHLIDHQALSEYCKKHLTAFKIPKKIERVELIPKTAIGKTMRSVLRKSYSAGN